MKFHRKIWDSTEPIIKIILTKVEVKRVGGDMNKHVYSHFFHL